MAAVRDDPVRRSVVPEAAGRSLWLAAIWTGVGAAAVCATLAIVAVAVCWLPVSGASGHSMSAVRAGLLSFLAALHGGVTVDGTSAQFLPLGLTIIVGLTAWRAGAGLGDVASSLGEQNRERLCVAGLAQAASFTLVALVAVPFAHLGTSSAPLLGVAPAGFLLFALTGGVAFVRTSALRGAVSERLPGFVPTAARAAGAAVAGYLGTGAIVVAASLVMHLSRVEALSLQVGGGWGGLPILLLGILSAPNAAIAASSYLAGPGFSLGSGTSVNALTTTHGVLPAFPILGALPQGHGAAPLMWTVIVTTQLAVGLNVARIVSRAGSWPARFRDAGVSAVFAAALMMVFVWQGGGGIGNGRLGVIGASPWRVSLMIAAQITVIAVTALATSAAWRWLRRGHDHRDEQEGTILGWLARNDFDARPKATYMADSTNADDSHRKGKLAG